MTFTNGLGWPHLLIIAAIFMLMFGAKRLPDAARSLGQSLKVFKSEIQGLHDDNQRPSTTAAVPSSTDTTPTPTTTPTSHD